MLKVLTKQNIYRRTADYKYKDLLLVDALYDIFWILRARIKNIQINSP